MSFIRKLITLPLVAACSLGLGVAANALTSPPSAQSLAVRPNGVTMVAGTGSFATGSSTVWVDLPGSQTSITVARGSSAYVLARFNAESVCWGTGGGGCPVRVVLFNGSSWEEIGTDISHYPNIGGALTPSARHLRSTAPTAASTPRRLPSPATRSSSTPAESSTAPTRSKSRPESPRLATCSASTTGISPSSPSATRALASAPPRRRSQAEYVPVTAAAARPARSTGRAVSSGGARAPSGLGAAV